MAVMHWQALVGNLDEGRRLMADASVTASKVSLYLSDGARRQVEQEMEQLRALWQELNALSTTTSDRLDHQHTSWLKFAEQSISLKLWLAEADRQLNVQATDMSEKKALLDRLKVPTPPHC